jgi:hypothetical protein
MSAVISLEQQDWDCKAHEREPILETIKLYKKTHFKMFETDSCDFSPIEICEKNLDDGWSDGYKIWLRVLPDKLLDDEAKREALKASYAKQFDFWRRHTPAIDRRLKRGMRWMPSPFRRRFGLIPSVRGSTMALSECDYVGETADASQWALVLHYEKTCPLHSAISDVHGEREFAVIEWFWKSFLDPKKSKPLPLECVPEGRVAVMLDASLPRSSCLARLHALFDEEAKRGREAPAAKLKSKDIFVTFARKDFAAMTDEDLISEIKNNNASATVLVHAQEFETRMARVFARPSALPRGLFLTPRPEASPPRIVIGTDNEVKVDGSVFRTPEHSLVVWDCIWEAVFASNFAPVR